MFTKSQYETIAAAIKGTRSVPDTAADEDLFTAGVNAACSEISDVLAATFAADNPRFDRARFLKACGVQS